MIRNPATGIAEKAVRHTHPELEPKHTPSRHRPNIHLLILRVVRMLSIMIVVILCAALLWSHYGHIANRHAIINGSTIEITAPGDGHVKLNEVTVGELVDDDTTLGSLNNPKTLEQEAECQTIQAKVMELEGALQCVQTKLKQRTDMLKKYTGLVTQQSRLDRAFAAAEVTRASHERDEKARIAQYAMSEAQRYARLARAGAVSLSDAEEAATGARRYQEIVNTKQAELELAKRKLDAVDYGLQLDSNRAFSSPAVELTNLQKEIADLHLTATDTQIEINSSRMLLQMAKQRLRRSTSVSIKVPRGGVVWAVETKNGELVKEGEPMLSILNPADRWVETYISEQDASRVHIGDMVKIKLLGDSRITFNGKIQSMRAGIDRSAASHNPAFNRIAVPPPEELHHEIAVRISVNWRQYHRLAHTLGPTEYFGVGRSVEVLF